MGGQRPPWAGRASYDPFPVNPYPSGRVTDGGREGTVLDQSGWDILVRWDGAKRPVWVDCEKLGARRGSLDPVDARSIAIAFMKRTPSQQLAIASDLGLGDDLAKLPARGRDLEILRRVRTNDAVAKLAEALGVPVAGLEPARHEDTGT